MNNTNSTANIFFLWHDGTLHSRSQEGSGLIAFFTYGEMDSITDHSTITAVYGAELDFLCLSSSLAARRV